MLVYKPPLFIEKVYRDPTGTTLSYMVVDFQGETIYTYNVDPLRAPTYRGYNSYKWSKINGVTGVITIYSQKLYHPIYNWIRGPTGCMNW